MTNLHPNDIGLATFEDVEMLQNSAPKQKRLLMQLTSWQAVIKTLTVLSVSNGMWTEMII
jgi:hypothetical protein